MVTRKLSGFVHRDMEKCVKIKKSSLVRVPLSALDTCGAFLICNSTPAIVKKAIPVKNNLQTHHSMRSAPSFTLFVYIAGHIERKTKAKDGMLGEGTLDHDHLLCHSSYRQTNCSFKSCSIS
jgi:hypothetical protein